MTWVIHWAVQLNDIYMKTTWLLRPRYAVLFWAVRDKSWQSGQKHADIFGRQSSMVVLDRPVRPVYWQFWRFGHQRQPSAKIWQGQVIWDQILTMRLLLWLKSTNKPIRVRDEMRQKNDTHKASTKFKKKKKETSIHPFINKHKPKWRRQNKN